MDANTLAGCGDRRALVWADEMVLAVSARRCLFEFDCQMPMVAVCSPLRRDVNVMLLRDELRPYVASPLKVG